MEKTSLTHKLRSETQPWRPWTSRTHAYKPYERAADSDQHLNKVPVTSHPVKLFWPKSRCFDYLYQDAEILLRNYPVQATICLYDDSDSEDEDDDEEEEEKELH